MLSIESARLRSWRAHLALEFERRAARTVLAARRHEGPLVVQKTLYPEGDGVCHGIVVHPPGGLAGGDDIGLNAHLDVDAHALLTTPGAGKWYRSVGPAARQSIQFEIGPGACLEWLPQENIVFNGAHAELPTVVRLASDGSYIGWEISCLGRSGSGENFATGRYRARTFIERDHRALWLENACLEGGGAALQAAAMLAGRPVVATMLAVSEKLDSAVLGMCRSVQPVTGDGAVTLLPGIIVGRYLGGSSEAAKKYFIKIWHLVRPVVAGREAVEPRIWQT
jgi:urease accessory protein